MEGRISSINSPGLPVCDLSQDSLCFRKCLKIPRKVAERELYGILSVCLLLCCILRTGDAPGRVTFSQVTCLDDWRLRREFAKLTGNASNVWESYFTDSRFQKRLSKATCPSPCNKVCSGGTVQGSVGVPEPLGGYCIWSVTYILSRERKVDSLWVLSLWTSNSCLVKRLLSYVRAGWSSWLISYFF